MSTAIAQTIRNKLGSYPFSDYFNENTLLIPTPKSSLPQRDELWVPQRIALAMANNGLESRHLKICFLYHFYHKKFKISSYKQ